MSDLDRTVHATGNDGTYGGGYEVVRYSRAGKWYQEFYDKDRRRQALTIAQAVDLAQRPIYGQVGGQAFDTKRRKAAPSSPQAPDAEEGRRG